MQRFELHHPANLVRSQPPSTVVGNVLDLTKDVLFPGRTKNLIVAVAFIVTAASHPSV
jgi:hypothetical protein